jgi:hypothetical protein
MFLLVLISLKLCDIIFNQLLYQRSNRNVGFAIPFGFFLYATDTSRQVIDALFRCRLSVSYDSLTDYIPSLATKCLNKARCVSSGPHLLAYDNVNLSTSIHVEQVGEDTPAKVTSGTFGIIYELRNGSIEHTKLRPILQRLRAGPSLNFFEDIVPSPDQANSVASQLRTTIIHILIKHCPDFKTYENHPDLSYLPRRPLPHDYRTQQYPTRWTTINEQTTTGNIEFLDNLYLDQLQHLPADLSDLAIPTINDQLTNSRIRAAKVLRALDVSPWQRLDNFQIGYGLFHGTMNLIWMILHVHRGSNDQPGSLTFFFSLLNKTRLGGKKPDYHTLYEALRQILDGIILNAWQRECGFPTLQEFAQSKPTSKALHDLAERIVLRYTDPIDEAEDDSDDSDCSDTESVDTAALNLKRLTTHLLFAVMLREAIRDGDFGRIEDFQGILAAMFCAGGSKNYCFELLYFIIHLNHVWPPQFACVCLMMTEKYSQINRDIMRDNMIIQLCAGKAMAVDTNIEENIGTGKVRMLVY